MAVDRANRDLLAGALTEFLRRDINEREFFDRLRPLEAIINPAEAEETSDDRLLYFCGTAIYGIAMGGPPPRDQAARERLCRCLVFLELDREYVAPEPQATPYLGPSPLDDRRRYRLHLLGFATSLVLVFVEGLWPLLSWWVLSFVLLFIMGNLEENRRWREWSARNPPPPDFGPFRDEADWRAHEHRLQRFRIPPYDPELDGPPATKTSWPALVIGAVLVGVVILGMGLLVLIMLFVLWPLSVLSGALATSDEPPDGYGSDL